MPEYLPFGSFKISKIVETLKEDEETVGQYYLKQILSDFNNKNYLQYLFLIK